MNKILSKEDRDEAERMEVYSREKYELDRQSELSYEWWRGRRQGRREGKLKHKNYVLELIAQGLSTEEIKQRLENDG